MDLPLDVFKWIISDYRTLLAFRCTCKDAAGAVAAIDITIRSKFHQTEKRALRKRGAGDKLLDTHFIACWISSTNLYDNVYDIYLGDQYAATILCLTNDTGVERFARLAALTDRDYVPFSGTPMCESKKEYVDRASVAGRVRVVDGIVYLPPRVVIEYFDPAD